MKNAVIYKGEWISKNSDAYKLWESKDWKALDQHLASIKEAARKRGGS